MELMSPHLRGLLRGEDPFAVEFLIPVQHDLDLSCARPDEQPRGVVAG